MAGAEPRSCRGHGNSGLRFGRKKGGSRVEHNGQNFLVAGLVGPQCHAVSLCVCVYMVGGRSATCMYVCMYINICRTKGILI